MASCLYGHPVLLIFFSFIASFFSPHQAMGIEWYTHIWGIFPLAHDPWIAAVSAAQNEHKMLFAFYLLFAQFYTHTRSPTKPGMDSACWLRLASAPGGFLDQGYLHCSAGAFTTLRLSGPA